MMNSYIEWQKKMLFRYFFSVCTFYRAKILGQAKMHELSETFSAGMYRKVEISCKGREGAQSAQL